jgi:broad specificity phosphatase PhoE
MMNNLAVYLIGILLVAGWFSPAPSAVSVSISDPAPLRRHRADTSDTVIFLVRHAEPTRPPYEDDPPNPSLNAAGQARAAALVHALAGAGVTRILSSEYRRTRETAGPLAERLGLEVEAYDPRALEPLAASLRQSRGRIVVVGHSNTTPALVELLGGTAGDAIEDAWEFDRLYVVTPGADGAASTIQLRYGAPSERP